MDLVRTLRPLAIALLLGSAARAADDAEEPIPPPPPPAAPFKPIVALSVVLALPTGPGIDVSLFPLERLEIGGQVATWVVLSSASAYARAVVLRWPADQVTLGARWLRGVGADVDPVLGYRVALLEAGYEHRFGSTFIAAELGRAMWVDGAWTPPGDRRLAKLTTEVRVGHLW